MFLVELAFDDDPRRLDARPAHRRLLADLKAAGTLIMGGPFADDAGGMLVFNVASDAEMRALMAQDPYYTAPGVTVIRVREWSPIFI